MNMTTFIIFNSNIFLYLLLFNYCLFFIGLYGFLFRSNHYIFLIICNEIMLFSIVLQFLLIGFMYDDIIPQLFVLFILLIASAEVVLVLSIIIRLYKISKIVYMRPVYFIPMEGTMEASLSNQFSNNNKK